MLSKANIWWDITSELVIHADQLHYAAVDS
jgi:hypothetical protein